MANFCTNCIYFHEAGDYGGGKCWRYPPQVLHVTNANGMSDFINETPYVAGNSSCGEFNSGAVDDDAL